MRLLVAAKEHHERRKLSLRTIVTETGVPISTVQGLMNDEARRVELSDIGKICTWLECDVGDLLKLEEVAEGTQP